MPEINGLLETAILAEDLGKACHFYEKVLGLRKMSIDGRGALFILPGRQLLIVIQKGASEEPNVTPAGTIPAWGFQGGTHLAFSIGHSDYEAWRERLEEHGVEIASETRWQRGGRSLYFRDPDDNLLELATPGVWDVY